ncbi:hypothetical protein PLANPX_2849 [Lacipirellula parvula]|uniref:Uncharacterized protein n=1 Tax=Lacipirellula parvula TaxID=2650471 RepID=A0A5K7XB50_9BACT|nr:hypothetical protein PLANPX_2849 [Lacipirellula parvula]
MDNNLLGLAAVAAVSLLALISFAWFRYRERCERRAAPGQGCPDCGSLRFRIATGQENEIVVSPRRQCLECLRLYSVPPPRWEGLVAYTIAAILLAAMLLDWFAHPKDMPITFSWYGRLAILSLAGALIYGGNRVIRGKS